MAKEFGVTKAESWAADQLIAMLEGADLPPWRKPWNAGGCAPMNGVYGRPYRGMNLWLTLLSGHSDPRYLTSKQIRELGGKFNAATQAAFDSGSFKGYTVVFWQFPTKAQKAKARAAGKRPPVPRCFAHRVYNIEQCEGLDMSKLKALPEATDKDHDPIEGCEAIVHGYKTVPKIEHGGAVAAYSPAFDSVRMPEMRTFGKVEEYYSTLFHELAHSTGHESRLARDGIMNPVRFGSHDYSEEELVAEFTAATLCGEAGIAPATLENSAAYVKTWHKRLKNDPDILVRAVRAANKAARYILNVTFDKEDKEEE